MSDTPIYDQVERDLFGDPYRIDRRWQPPRSEEWANAARWAIAWRRP